MSPMNNVCSKPWVVIMPGETDASGRVRQYGIDYLEQWLREFESLRTPAAIEALDRREPQMTHKRVRAMLHGIQDYLADCDQKEVMPLHAPICIETIGGRISTSPLLLSVAATVYSQTDWDQYQFHDIYSATRTQLLLDKWEFPPAIVDKITLLVGLKNAFRTAIGTDKEVCVSNSRQLSFEDDDLARCFASILKACWQDNPECGCEALTLVTMAYEARFGTPKISRPEFQAFGTKVKQALNCSGALDSEAQQDTLAHLELSRYAFPVFKDRKARAQDIISYLLQARADSKPFMLWLSMDRYWSTIHPTRLAGLSDLPLYFCERVPVRPRSFVGPLAAGHTLLYGLELDPNKAFEMIYKKYVQLANKPQLTIWERIGITLEKFRERRKPDSRIPTAYIARALQILSHCYPKEMFELCIGRPDDHPGMETSTSLWLPREVPSIAHLEEAIKNGEYTDPQLLVVRCAASAVVNRCISYGYLVRVLESDPRDALKPWTELINWCAAKNAHEALVTYLKIVLAPPPDTLYPVPRRRSAKTIRDPLILGIDIGGTSIRAACYHYDPAREQLGTRIREMEPLNTIDQGAPQYDDATALVTRIVAHLERDWGQGWIDYRPRIVAVGVTWPGAVGNQSGLGFVAGPSGTLAYFRPYPKQFWNATAEEIRQFGLREAFEECFTVDGECPHIKLINDGDAHVLHETWQLEGFTLSPGEVAMGLTAGTGSGWAILDGDTGYPLDVLAEVGRLITHISDPFPGTDRFPVGTGRDAFNKDTLGKVAQRLLNKSLPHAADVPDRVPSLLISWIIESQHSSNVQVTRSEFEARWQRERPKDELRSLADLRASLAAFLKKAGRVDWATEVQFADEVVRWAGYELADLVATTTGIFKAISCITGGGPLSGWIGRALREHAREELKETYSYDVAEDPTSAIGIRLPSLIRFPEPYLRDAPPGPAGAHGAALAASKLLQSIPSVQPKAPSVEIQARPSLPPPKGVSFSAFSILHLGENPPGRVFFPGRDHMPEHTLGYIRSDTRAQIARDLGSPRYAASNELPWRDYDDDALTCMDDLILAPYKHDGVIISARNTLNEWGYQLRFDGHWWRRYGDDPIDRDWPVVQCGQDGVRLVRLAAAKPEANLITGIPLAIEGIPSSREFLVARCSDVAHVFDVDPKGRRGPSAEAWQELSNLWQELKDKKLTDSEFAMQMEQQAKCLNVAPSHHLLHSILAQCTDGSLIAFAITGSLTDIANELVQQWAVRHAVLLDNGGSVGWQALVPGAKAPVILVSGPNYRPQGTVFLALETEGYLHPRSHSALGRRVRE